MARYDEFIAANKKNYDLMRQRERQGMTFREIAEPLGITITSVRQRYQDFKLKQITLYTNYLREVTDETGLEKKTKKLLLFYYDLVQVTAYLEREYKELLDDFRGENPPTVVNFLPYYEISQERTVELMIQIAKEKDIDKKSFNKIANELGLTPSKTVVLYQDYYCAKVEDAISVIQPTVDFNLSGYLYSSARKSSDRWKLLVKDYSGLIQNLLD